MFTLENRFREKLKKWQNRTNEVMSFLSYLSYFVAHKDRLDLLLMSMREFDVSGIESAYLDLIPIWHMVGRN